MPTDAESSSKARRLTSGRFEAGFGSWPSDSKRIAFYDNESSPMERFVRVVDVETGEIEPIVTEKGVNYWPRFSPDDSRLVLERTDIENSVDLYVVDVQRGAQLTRLSSSMPEEIQKTDLIAPEPVHFPSRVDGKQVPGSVFLPKGLDRSRRHPAIVWIHGSGSDQNFLGWHPFSYRMYYSASQYLVQQGYVVLTVDYRGSSGYGREWGTGHHLDLGGPDALDVASGADYLKTLSYVDPDRIGVWGAELWWVPDIAGAHANPHAVPLRHRRRWRHRLGYLGTGIERRLDNGPHGHAGGERGGIYSHRAHQAYGNAGEAPAHPSRYSGRQRRVPGISELGRRTPETREGVRLRSLSGRAPFLPAQTHTSGCVEARRAVFRCAFETGSSSHEPLIKKALRAEASPPSSPESTNPSVNPA